jgi:membrane protein implicated in regulation of membrane protease activity
MEAVVWIVLGVALAIAEMFTATLLLIMFAVGAFAAAAAAALGAGIGVQALVFAATSALTVFAIRPVIKKHTAIGNTAETPMGVEAMQGAWALVLERVDDDGGVVKIDGETWRARSFDATQVLQPGERVRVIDVKGATAMVWRDELTQGDTSGER